MKWTRRHGIVGKFVVYTDIFLIALEFWSWVEHTVTLHPCNLHIRWNYSFYSNLLFYSRGFEGGASLPSSSRHTHRYHSFHHSSEEKVTHLRGTNLHHSVHAALAWACPKLLAPPPLEDPSMTNVQMLRTSKTPSGSKFEKNWKLRKVQKICGKCLLIKGL